MSISGRLPDVSILEIVQFIRLGGKTGTLRVATDDGRAELGFRDGRITQVAGQGAKAIFSEVARKARGRSPPEVDELLREAVAYVIGMMAEWDRGSFTFSQGVLSDAPDSRRAGLPIFSIDPEGLVLRVMQLVDERRQSRPERSRTGDLVARAQGDALAPMPSLSDVALDAGRLLRLYVATHQLHASLDMVHVQTAIKEILANMLGVESFVLLLRNDEAAAYEIALSEGHCAYKIPSDASRRYQGGIMMLDRALTDGAFAISTSDDSPVLAAIPLRGQEELVGALGILKLFDHKQEISDEDRDILQLLGVHAASALKAARLYSRTDRRLRALESLVDFLKTDPIVHR